MAGKAESFAVLTWKLAKAMSLDCEVVTELRTRPKRTVVGKVSMLRRDESRRIDPKSKADHSSMLATVAGEELPVERMASVGLRGVS